MRPNPLADSYRKTIWQLKSIARPAQRLRLPYPIGRILKIKNRQSLRKKTGDSLFCEEQILTFFQAPRAQFSPFHRKLRPVYYTTTKNFRELQHF